FMSSDFLADTNNRDAPRFVLQAKYVSALDDERTVEKLEIERRYWLEKGVHWYLVTEQQIPHELGKNIRWLYPAARNIENNVLPIEQIEFYQHQFEKRPNQTIISSCKKLDIEYDLPTGESLHE